MVFGEWLFGVRVSVYAFRCMPFANTLSPESDWSIQHSAQSLLKLLKLSHCFRIKLNTSDRFHLGMSQTGCLESLGASKSESSKIGAQNFLKLKALKFKRSFSLSLNAVCFRAVNCLRSSGWHRLGAIHKRHGSLWHSFKSNEIILSDFHFRFDSPGASFALPEQSAELSWIWSLNSPSRRDLCNF